MTSYITELIVNQIESFKDAIRNEFCEIIKNISACATLRGRLYENRSNNVLSNGLQLNMKSLCSGGGTDLEVSLAKGEYEKMSHANSESVDGYCVKDENMYLFQITVASTHPACQS